MSLFGAHISIENLNKINRNTLAEHLGIVFTEIGSDYLMAKMPVDSRTQQPLGLLHGGASVVLAETLGSVAAYSVIDRDTQYCLGLEIKANHVKSAKTGFVYGKTFPVHIGRKTHIWDIEIRNEQKELVCTSRITMIIMNKKES